MAMKKAIDLGVTTLEMDAHITKDRQVVIAHDHYINRGFSLDPNGNEIPEQEAQSHLIYDMTYDQLRRYDVGSKTNVSFPQQENIKAHIPLLEDLIDSVQAHLKATNSKQVFYNIETKSKVKGDGLWHPKPEEFVDLLMEVVDRKKITPWVTIQSFDVRTLQVLKKKYPHVRTSYLVTKGSLVDNLQLLGFTPDIYSPAYKLVDKELIETCHDQGLKVIPWTVNTLEEINQLKALGVDGIISDYPNLF
jgi:glycerophosphoryl diester phosphodiesterase